MTNAAFHKLHVLLVGGRPDNVRLLRGLLASLGIEDIAIADNSLAANAALTADAYDAVFCDEASGPANAVNFALALRRKSGTKNRRTPIFLILDRPLVRRVELARDAGINGVLLRPFSQLAVKRKLIAVLLRPRSFVNNPRYAGPDRRQTSRRRAGEGIAKTGWERRNRLERRHSDHATS